MASELLFKVGQYSWLNIRGVKHSPELDTTLASHSLLKHVGNIIINCWIVSAYLEDKVIIINPLLSPLGAGLEGGGHAGDRFQPGNSISQHISA